MVFVLYIFLFYGVVVKNLLKGLIVSLETTSSQLLYKNKKTYNEITTNGKYKNAYILIAT